MPQVYVEMLDTDRMVHCVRDLRQCFGIGLKEAVDFFHYTKERGFQATSFEYSTFNELHTPTSIRLHFYGPPSVKRSEKTHKIFRKDDSGSSAKIMAIKDLRYALGIGLKEAKDIMDEMWGFQSNPHEKYVHMNLAPEEAYKLREFGFEVISNVYFELEEDLFTI